MKHILIIFAFLIVSNKASIVYGSSPNLGPGGSWTNFMLLGSNTQAGVLSITGTITSGTGSIITLEQGTVTLPSDVTRLGPTVELITETTGTLPGTRVSGTVPVAANALSAINSVTAAFISGSNLNAGQVISGTFAPARLPLATGTSAGIVPSTTGTGPVMTRDVFDQNDDGDVDVANVAFDLYGTVTNPVNFGVFPVTASANAGNPSLYELLTRKQSDERFARLRLPLRGADWDLVVGGHTGTLNISTNATATGAYWSWQSGPWWGNAAFTLAAQTGFVWNTGNDGITVQSSPTAGAIAIIATAPTIGAPAGAWPQVVASRKVSLSRVRVPAAASRLERQYWTNASFGYAGTHQSYAGIVGGGIISGTSNRWACVIWTNGTTYDTYTTSTTIGTTTYTAYDISDATRELWVRTTLVTGGTNTIEIAPYSPTPIFTTVVTTTAPVVSSVGVVTTSTLAPAISTANTMQITELFYAHKY